MKTTKFFVETGQIGIVLTAVALLTVIGCGDNVNTASPPGQTASTGVLAAPSPGVADAPTPEVVQAVSPTIVTQDDYVYYPSYGIYYSSGRHQYASLEGGAWISQPAPRGVSVDALRSSPSVKMDFHDSPANHHATIVRQYPTNWKPSASNQKGDEHERK